jgi:long-chain acyl-CoA synthetase
MGSSSSKVYDYDGVLLADEAEYSKFFEGDEKADDDCTPPRRNVEAIEAGKLIDQPFGCSTVWELFQKGVSENGESDCFGTRTFIYPEDVKVEEGEEAPTKVTRGEYKFLNYNEVNERAINIGRGLASLGFGKETNVGIYALNRAEWMLTALGLYSQTMRVVALYATLGADAVEYICNHSELPIVFTSKQNLKTLLQDLPKLEHLKYIVQFDVNPDFDNRADTIDEDDVKLCQENGVELIGFTDVLKKGAEFNSDDNADVAPKGEDLAIIMYTSGTTGKPKGVMLAHECFAAVVREIPGLTIDNTDRHYSYLPLAHSFETVVQAMSLSQGVSIGFFQGDIKKLTDDLGALKPTFMAGVPRVFQKMYDKVMEGVKDRFCVVRYVFHDAYAEQAQAVRKGERIAKHDEKIFGKIKDKIGMSEMRTIVTGGAPCPPYLLEFLKIVIGCDVLQGYGLTETAAALTVTYPQDLTIGHVGPPSPWAEIRLKSVPEMGYLVSDEFPRGEVQVRGKGVFKGYFKEQDKTDASFDDGWFCTGDVGRWNKNGTLSIIDRKKNILKLSQGEYVAVEAVEGVYSKSTLVNQMYVYGNSYKRYLVAVVVPSPEAILRIAQENGKWKDASPVGTPEFIQEFAKVFEENRELFEKVILEDMKKQESTLKGFEKVKKVHFETELDAQLLGFNVENECLTPTFKLRRPFLRQRYLESLKQMYTDLGDPPKDDERW